MVIVPTNPDIGEFHDPEVKKKYPPGSQIECSNTSMSLLVLMQSQSKGLGKSIIRTSLETLKEMGVKAYSEMLSTDTASLSSWLVQEGLIKDYCRVKLLREEPNSSAGVYVRVVSV